MLLVVFMVVVFAVMLMMVMLVLVVVVMDLWYRQPANGINATGEDVVAVDVVVETVATVGLRGYEGQDGHEGQEEELEVHVCVRTLSVKWCLEKVVGWQGS